MWQYTKESFEKGLLDESGGFLSVRIANDRVMITPPAAKQEMFLTQEVPLYDMNGSRLAPSGQVEDHPEIDFVLETMKARHDVSAVGHFHPHYATAFSRNERSIPFVVSTAETVLKEILWVRCKTCPHRFEGLCQCIEGQRKSYAGVNNLLIENDGIVCMGEDLKAICDLANLMEENAKVAYQTLNPAEKFLKKLNQPTSIRAGAVSLRLV
ncbi:class II aldolase/adducin family protein [Thermodesulfobacteriota bacterium]